MTKLLCVVGPTASGKTALAVELALRVGGEVVSCDSMQVYRGMDIGTAKPTAAERKGVPHHMLDVVAPSEEFSAARYAAEAGVIVDDILSRGKTPILAGGTGLYLRALVRGLPPSMPDDGGLTRQKWQDFALQNGSAALWAALQNIDPETADRLPHNDLRRIVRALEVFDLTGVPLSEHHRLTQAVPPRYETFMLGLRPADRGSLYRRIEARVDDMLVRGLVGEVQTLLGSGLSPQATAMQAIGYKEVAAHLAGLCSLPEAAAAVKIASTRYAKRQLTWFSRQEDTRWLCADDENLVNLSTEYLEKF